MSQPFPSILPGEPPWSPSEQTILLEFLRSAVGQLFLRNLIYRRPQVTERANRDLRNVQLDTLSGYEECFQQILDLANSSPLSSADRSAQSRP